MIPKILHFTWVGDDPLPLNRLNYIDSWMRCNPDWTVKIWTAQNLPALINRREYDETKSPVQKSDILRCELVYRYGGVYVDSDFECFKNITPLLSNTDAFVCSEDEHWLCNSIFGAVPEHPFFKLLVERLPASFAKHPDNICRATASVFLTWTFDEYVGHKYEAKDCWEDSSKLLTVFPPQVFFPIRWDGKIFGPISEAYGQHKWFHNWKDEDRQNGPKI